MNQKQTKQDIMENSNCCSTNEGANSDCCPPKQTIKEKEKTYKKNFGVFLLGLAILFAISTAFKNWWDYQ